jgi:hypothetical protein
MELLALGKPIKKPPRSDERDGELFCGTGLGEPLEIYTQNGGYCGYLNCETGYAQYSNAQSSHEYLTMNKTTITAKKPCKVKIWHLTDGNDSGTTVYQELTLNTNETYTHTDARFFQIAFVYSP